MIGIELRLILAALLLASIGGAYLYGRHDGRVACEEKYAVKEAAATKADLESLATAVQNANSIAMGTQDLLNKGRAKSVIDRGIISHEIKTNPIYLNDCLHPTGVMQWNALSQTGAAVPNSAPLPQFDSPVSSGNGPAAAGRKSRIIAPIAPGGKADIR